MYTVNYTPAQRIAAPSPAAHVSARTNRQPKGLSRKELRRLVEEMLG